MIYKILHIFRHFYKFREPLYLKTAGGGDIPYGKLLVCRVCNEKRHEVQVETFADIKRNYSIVLK